MYTHIYTRVYISAVIRIREIGLSPLPDWLARKAAKWQRRRLLHRERSVIVCCCIVVRAISLY